MGAGLATRRRAPGRSGASWTLRPSNGASVSTAPPRCAASAGPAARLVVVADPRQASSGLPNPYTRTHAGLGRDPYAPPRRTFPGRRRRSNCGAEQAPRSRRRDGRLGRPGGASYASPGDGRFARANAGVSAPAARASEARPRRACGSTRAARSLSMRERAVSGRRRVALGARELLSSAARVGASSGSASAVGCRRRRTHAGVRVRCVGRQGQRRLVAPAQAWRAPGRVVMAGIEPP